MNRSYKVDEVFFSTWTESSAYVLGIAATDGCVTYVPGVKYELKIELKDNDLLSSIRNILAPDAPLHPRKKRHNGTETRTWALHTRSKKLVEDLIILGVTPQKSFTVSFPCVPDQYLADFIRGVFDGDGSVYIDVHRKYPILKTKITSASSNFVEALSQVLHEKVNVMLGYFTEHDKYYTVHYGAKDSIKLFDFMYKESTIELTGKRDVFEQFIAQRGKDLDLIHCHRCGEPFHRTSNRSRWCPECKPIVRREQWAINGYRKKLRRQSARGNAVLIL